MQKLLVYLISCATPLIAGCTTVSNIASAIPEALGRTSLMYKPDIQQGNVLQQKDINRLQLGMTKNQVKFIMGTPMLVDTFHLERWDYLYLLNAPGKKPVRERVTLFFEDDSLIQIAGDLYPNPEADESPDEEGTIFSVPDYVAEEKGLITRALGKFKMKPNPE